MNPTPSPRRPARRRGPLMGLLSILLLAAGAGVAAPAAHAAGYTRISGNGSSWAGNAVSQWLADVKAQGVTVDYTPDGSSSGRKNFAVGLSDFAVSEIPYTGDTADPQDTTYPNFAYALLPTVAGGTSFMYNLPVNGSRMTTLNLSQEALAKIFSGQVTMWNDPVITATNPGVNVPAQRITVVVRSDGSGATAQFTLWMLRQFPADYAALCAKTGCNPGSATSYFPYQGLSNFTAQSGSNGVTTYTANTPYTINYDEYSYALGVNFPVVQVQNAAGFFITPTDTGVAVALTQAVINSDKTSPNYLSQDLSKVYAYKDPRTYPISAYSYLVVPAETRGNFDAAKGATLGYFSSYALCEGQRSMGALGYSPLPMNLVLAALDQVLRIPGVDADTQALIQSTKSGVTSGASNPCNNPTFQPGDDPAHNVLIDTAPFPPGCDAACQAPWLTRDAGTQHSAPGGKGHHGNDAGGAPSTGPSAAPSATTSAGAGGTVTAPPPSAAVPGDLTAAAPPTCDADTGACASTDPTVSDGVALVATPAVIDGGSTWGGLQLAIVICLLLALLLVVVPAVASNALDRRRSSSGGSTGTPQ